MTFEEFQVFMTPLAMHFREVRDVPTWRLYHAALLAPPAPSRQLLERALIRSANRRFFPSTDELRADAEAERQAFLKRHPYERCAECRDSHGWVTVVDDQGVERAAKCLCFKAYCERLALQGITERPVLQLAAGSEESSL